MSGTVRNSLLCLALCFVHIRSWAQARFVSPVAGTYGRDFKLINYVDWAPDTFTSDHHCYNKTYDGHQGTDFVIRNFRAMDSGRNVLAADNGRVFFIKDGLFDREKTSVVAKGLGNYIGIRHSGKLQTYYGHLRKGSVIVKVGDSVVAGQKLALVGSSGNSSDPHLHFELWYDSTYYIDPFKGPCGNTATYWKSEPAFDTAYGSWTSGMCNYLCTLDTLKEEPLRRDTFYAKDPAITYWNLQYGLRKNDSVRIDWYTPSGMLWLRYGYRLPYDWWYYYFWSYMAAPATGEEGKWTVKLYRNNVQVTTRPFYFYKKTTDVPASVLPPGADFDVMYDGDRIIVKGGVTGGRFMLYDLTGRIISTFPNDGRQISFSQGELAGGMYVIEQIAGNERLGRKKILAQ